MARMHSRKKGKSGSTKPIKKAVPSWSSYKPKEIEMLIVKMSKEGKTASQIGIILRDVYGIPSTKLLAKKKITQLLEAKKLTGDVPEDLMALMKKDVMIKKHMETNKKDTAALRGLQLTESKIKRLVKYYKEVGKLDKTWKFDPEKIKLVIE